MKTCSFASSISSSTIGMVSRTSAMLTSSSAGNVTLKAVALKSLLSVPKCDCQKKYVCLYAYWTLPATLGEMLSSAGRVKVAIFNPSASSTVIGVTLKSTGFPRIPSCAILISIIASSPSFCLKSGSDSENSTPTTV